MKLALPLSLLILKEACQRFSYSWRLVDNSSYNLIEVSSAEKKFFANRSSIGPYPLNTNFSVQLVNDKVWTYQVLAQKGYKIPAGEYFFLKKEFQNLRGEGRELEDALEFAQDKYPVFVKPNNGSKGILSAFVNSQKELKAHLETIAKACPIVLIQKIINLPEYRIFAIDGEVKFVYQRLAPEIIGNNRDTVSTLIKELNQKIASKKNWISNRSAFLQAQLVKYNLSLESVLPLGERIRVSQKTNIAAGGSIQNYSEAVSQETNQWVKKLMTDLSLRICGIDIFVQDSINQPDNFTVIEVNSNPGLSGIYKSGQRDEVMRIWQEILSKYFKE